MLDAVFFIEVTANGNITESTFFFKFLYELYYLRYHFCNLRISVCFYNIKFIHLHKIIINKLFCQIYRRNLFFQWSVYNFIVNIGKILNMIDSIPASYEMSFNNIKSYISSCMSQMTNVVRCNSANIYWYIIFFYELQIH